MARGFHLAAARGVGTLSLAIAASLMTTAGTQAASLTTSTATPITTIGGSATAQIYAWGTATMPDGSILVGDYWNLRVVHYNANGTPATPFVFADDPGFGPGTNQSPFGMCVDLTHGAEAGDVYVTEGSLYNINMYSSTGKSITSWGNNKAVNPLTSPSQVDYPSQCAVNPVNEDVYVSNQFGQTLLILDPSHPSAAPRVVTIPAPNTFIQPRGLAFDSAGNLWVADQGHHRIDIYPNGVTGNKPIKTIQPPGGVSTTFDMRGMAIDTTNNLMFVTNGQNCLVQEFNANPSSSQEGQFITNFNEVGAGGSDCGTGPGQFEDGARGVAVDGNHDVWVGDLGDFRAQVFTESGKLLQEIPTPPSPPPTGGFNGPRGAAFDAAGDLFVTDTYNERMEKFTLVGGVYKFSLAWGMRGETPNTFNYPRLECFDPSNGDVIIANTDFERDRRMEHRRKRGLGGHRPRRPIRRCLRVQRHHLRGEQQRSGRGGVQQLGRADRHDRERTRVRARHLGRHRRLDLDRRRRDRQRLPLLRRRSTALEVQRRCCQRCVRHRR